MDARELFRRVDEAYDQKNGSPQLWEELANLVENGKDRRDVIVAANELSLLSIRRGDLGAAEEFGRKSLANAREEFGSESTETANAIMNLGAIESACGRHNDSLALFQEALEIYDGEYGNKDKLYYNALVSIAREYQAIEQYDLAIYWLQLAVETCHAMKQYLAMAKHTYDIGMIELIVGNVVRSEEKLSEAAGICLEADLKDSDVYRACTEALEVLRTECSCHRKENKFLD